MRKLAILSLVVLLTGCAMFQSVQEKWNLLTPDEKARVVIGDLQGQLNGLFDQGQSYVAMKPQYQVKWKSQIVPAFDQANKTLSTVINLGKTQPLTPEYVYLTVNPRIVEVVSYLVAIGVIKQ